MNIHLMPRNDQNLTKMPKTFLKQQIKRKQNKLKTVQPQIDLQGKI